MKATQKKKKKPKYNMFQNSWFMIKLAWRQNEKKVIFTAILLALLGVILNLINLFCPLDSLFKPSLYTLSGHCTITFFQISFIDMFVTSF